MSHYWNSSALNLVGFSLLLRTSPPVRNHSWRTLGKYIKMELLYGTKENDGWAVRQQPVNGQRWAGGKWKETKVNKHCNLEYVGQPGCSELSPRHPAVRRLWTTLKMDVAVKTAALAPTYTEGSICDSWEGVKRPWEVLARLENPSNNTSWSLQRAKAEANHLLMASH